MHDPGLNFLQNIENHQQIVFDNSNALPTPQLQPQQKLIPVILSKTVLTNNNDLTNKILTTEKNSQIFLENFIKANDVAMQKLIRKFKSWKALIDDWLVK